MMAYQKPVSHIVYPGAVAASGAEAAGITHGLVQPVDRAPLQLHHLKLHVLLASEFQFD